MVKNKIQINMASYLEYLIQKYLNLDLSMEKKHSLDYSHYENSSLNWEAAIANCNKNRIYDFPEETPKSFLIFAVY